MLTVLSPAKTLDYDSKLPSRKFSTPRMTEETRELVSVMAGKSPADLRGLMDISDELAQLNYERYQVFEPEFTRANSRPAVMAFKGDVYMGLNVEEFGERDFTYAQKHLRILSGLYGVLRPLDLMQPYRLEMGTALKTDHGDDLYSYWGSRITTSLNGDLANYRTKVLINLASKEYFGAVRTDELDGKIVSPVFRDFNRGEYRIISFFAKRARGEMAAWMIRNKIKSVRALREFDGMGYEYSPAHSTSARPTFIRGAA